MTAPRGPEPEEPRPLSDHEQRAFSDLEARLVDGDPAPGGRLRRSPPRPASQPSSTLNAIVQAAVVGTVLVGGAAAAVGRRGRRDRLHGDPHRPHAAGRPPRPGEPVRPVKGDRPAGYRGAVRGWLLFGVTIAALFRYPVKSMLGESLTPRRVRRARGGGRPRLRRARRRVRHVASAKVPKRWAKLLEFSAAFTGGAGAGRGRPAGRDHVPGRVDAAQRRPRHRPGPLRRARPRGQADHHAARRRRVRGAVGRPRGHGARRPGPEKIIEATTARQEDTGEAISRFDVAAFAPSGRFYDLAALHVITESTLDAPARARARERLRRPPLPPNVVLSDTEAGFVENDWPGREMTLGTTSGSRTRSRPCAAS